MITKNYPYRDYRRKYYLANREYYIERAKKWKKNNPERYRETRLLWNKNNRKKRREYHRKYRITSGGVRGRLIKLLGNRCSNQDCLVPNGCTDTRCLQIDHINGGGVKQVKKLGSNGVYRYYYNRPEEAKKDLQLLCANCNWIKRAIQKESLGRPLLEFA